jgi:hypothetical protein
VTLPGLYTFELAGTSNDGVRVTKTFSFVVNDDIGAGNASPTAQAGADQTSKAGATVVLTAAASTDDVATIGGGTLKPFWTQKAGPPVVLSDPYAVAPTFTPVSGGVYVFELSVTDGSAQSLPDHVQVFVAPSARAAGGGGGGGGGCGSTGLEWLLFLPAIWAASAIRRRLKA